MLKIDTTKCEASNGLKSGVYLIGAGPGAYDLITVRGAQILAQADIVFVDALIDQNMLSWCTKAKIIEVGKRCGKFSTAQMFINQQLISASKNYDVVVRLKGGDPLIFGRATEEIDALKQANIYFEIVPGITTALAACAEVKQAPTSRGISRSVTLTTLATHLNYEDQETLIYYMGRDQLSQIGHDLISKGYSPNTPVCLLESVSLPKKRSFGTNLQELIASDLSHIFSQKEPVIALIGEVYRQALLDLPKLSEFLDDGESNKKIVNYFNFN